MLVRVSSWPLLISFTKVTDDPKISVTFNNNMYVSLNGCRGSGSAHMSSFQVPGWRRGPNWVTPISTHREFQSKSYMAVSDNEERVHVPPTGELYKPQSKKWMYNIFMGEGANRYDQEHYLSHGLFSSRSQDGCGSSSHLLPVQVEKKNRKGE